MNQQHVGHDFFQSRLQSSDVPKRTVSTVTYTSRECPVCKRFARTLVRPPQHELQCEICVDFCGGNVKYPNAYTSFQGSWIKDGNVLVETLRGSDGAPGVPGPPGREGKDAAPPTRQELRSLLQEILDEEKARGFWRKFLRLCSRKGKGQ